MLWLGVLGRRKLAALEERCSALEQALEECKKGFRALDLEMTDQVDRLTGIAKRIQGRRGGRPPGKEDGDRQSETENGSADQPSLPFFNRHVL
jgi:TolA-binding protein